MKEKIIAKRYAEAFFEYAKSLIGEQQALLELKQFKDIYQKNTELKQFLEAKEIGYEEKSMFIDSVFKDILSIDTKDFLKLLIKKGRIHYIIEIIEYSIINYSEEEAVYTILKTNFPLDKDTIQNIKTKLENKLNKRININEEIDKTLLGGIKIVIGNDVIDDSIKGRLDELKQKLAAVKM